MPNSEPQKYHSDVGGSMILIKIDLIEIEDVEDEVQWPTVNMLVHNLISIIRPITRR